MVNRPIFHIDKSAERHTENIFWTSINQKGKEKKRDEKRIDICLFRSWNFLKEWVLAHCEKGKKTNNKWTGVILSEEIHTHT